MGQNTWQANKLGGPNITLAGPVPGRPTRSVAIGGDAGIMFYSAVVATDVCYLVYAVYLHLTSKIILHVIIFSMNFVLIYVKYVV